MNDSSSEVDGDDFRAKTVGTREAEVCINIQFKKVIGFDELADKLFTPLYQFHFQESEAYTLYNKALGLQRQDIQKAEEAFEQLLSHGFIREVFYCVTVRLVLNQHQITQWVEHLTRKSLPGSNFWFGPSLFLLYCYIWRHANS